jgi:hypothetical protein
MILRQMARKDLLNRITHWIAMRLAECAPLVARHCL